MKELMVVSLLTGMLGSLHCIGMCGPLALSLPLSGKGHAGKFTGTLLYNLGRVTTYSALGLLTGLIGQTFSLFGFQQYLSIAAGVLIILLVIVPKKNKSGQRPGFMAAFFSKTRAAMGRLFSKSNSTSLYAIGLLNGLLPCGLVYMALTAATATGSITGGMLFMAFFGLGTLPAMWTLAFFGHFISVPVRIRIRKIYPYMMTLMACLLIIRGMGLGIPHLSPAMDTGKKVVQCCHKP